MKKKIITAALIMAAICGTTTISAQRPGCGNCPDGAATCAPAQCSDSAACCKQGPYDEIFAGLNLTPEQQQKIKELKPARPAKADRTKGQRPDSATMARRKADRKQAQKDYLNGVKAILTPEQYVAFLEAVVVEQPGRPAMLPRHGREMRAGRAERGEHRMEARKDRKVKGNKAMRHADKAKAKAEKSSK